MADQPNVFNTLINPVQVQSYERYLPTAFDEGMTLLEKINKVILQLNRIGKLSNDVLDQWNQVMDWVMADGLDASIDSKIDSMLQDGSLATIIGTAITDLGNEMGSLSDLTTTDKTSIVRAINSVESDLTTFETTMNTNFTQYKTDTTTLITNTFYYGTPEQYGAKGDGITDDTSAIQQCLNACKVTSFKPTSYLISGTLTLPKQHSIEGNHAELLVGNSFTPNTLGSAVNAYTILYVAPRGQTYQEELANYTQFVNDLRITGNPSFSSMVGMHLGVTDQNLVTQSTSVNYSVTGSNFNNISISKCSTAIKANEIWSCTFKNIFTSYLTDTALAINGQAVNNTFVGCTFATASQGNIGVYINHGVYNGSNRRPEGNTFIGGYIGSAEYGVQIEDAFVTKFSNIIMDINTISAVLLHNSNGISEDSSFESCYLMSTGSLVVNIGDSSNPDFSSFKNCNFIPSGTGTNAMLVGQNKIVNVEGCQITGTITVANNSRGNIINNFWNAISTSTPQILLTGGTGVVTTNNRFKLDGSAVATA